MKRLMYVLGVLFLLTATMCPTKAQKQTTQSDGQDTQYTYSPIPPNKYMELEKDFQKTWASSIDELIKAIPSQKTKMQLEGLKKLLLERQLFWVPGVGSDTTPSHRQKGETIMVYPSSQKTASSTLRVRNFSKALKKIIAY